MYGTQFPQLVIANIKTILFADGSTLLAYYKYRTNWPAVYIKSQFVTVSPVWVKLRSRKRKFRRDRSWSRTFYLLLCNLASNRSKICKNVFVRFGIKCKSESHKFL